MAQAAKSSITTVEATVTSKGQITLPNALRKRFGLQKGSRVRFSMPSTGPVEVEPVRYELEDLWQLAESTRTPNQAMSFNEMNEAKMKRVW